MTGILQFTRMKMHSTAEAMIGTGTLTSSSRRKCQNWSGDLTHTGNAFCIQYANDRKTIELYFSAKEKASNLIRHKFYSIRK